MAYVTLIWAGRRRQRSSDPPHAMPADACLARLGLRAEHYSGETPPYLPSENPLMDDYREAHGVAVHLQTDETPPGWRPGWYVIPSEDLAVEAARAALARYPVTALDSWIRRAAV